MYRVEFSNLAARELQKVYSIDRKLYFRLLTAAETLSVNPYQGKRLKGKLSGDYSLRVGDYRIIYIVHKKALVVIVIDLGHRKEIYR